MQRTAGGAAAANAPDPLHGGALCERAAMPLERSFLLLAGQLRATIDFPLLPPATQADDRGLTSLYGMPWVGGGLAGVDDDVLHDPTRRARLLALLDAWQPTYSPAYDPGWQVRKRPDAVTYAASIAQAKSDLRKQLDRLVRPDSDDEFFAMQREYDAILVRVPRQGGMSPASTDGKRLDALEQRIRVRGLTLGVDMGPPPPDLPKLAAGTSPAPPVDEPPASPDRSEAVTTFSNRTLVTCTDQAERLAVRSGGAIARRLVTVSARWGTVLRADITGGDQEPTRFTCSDRFTAEQPSSLHSLQPLRVRDEPLAG